MWVTVLVHTMYVWSSVGDDHVIGSLETIRGHNTPDGFQVQAQVQFILSNQIFGYKRDIQNQGPIAHLSNNIAIFNLSEKLRPSIEYQIQNIKTTLKYIYLVYEGFHLHII